MEIGREELVIEGTQAKTVLRWKDWVYIPPYDGPRIARNTNIELGNLPEPQLYDLSVDIGQIQNLAKRKRDLLETMSTRLETVLQGDNTRLS